MENRVIEYAILKIKKIVDYPVIERKNKDFKIKLCDKDVISRLTVIHYGRKHFNPFVFEPIRNVNYFKPDGGLWTSPVNSNYGWIDWNKQYKWIFCDPSKSFKLRFYDNAKIMIIDGKEDLDELPTYIIRERGRGDVEYVDFKKLSKVCDAIWLTEKGVEKTESSYPVSLSGWDCETVLIMNKKCCYQWKH